MSPLSTVEDSLTRALRRLEPRTSYAEALAQSTDGHSLRLDRQARTPEPGPQLDGVVFRAWDGAKWIEGAASGFAPRTLEAIVDDLAGRLPASALATPPPGESPTGRLERSTVERRPLVEFALERRLELARCLFDWSMAVPGVSNTIVTLAHQIDERLFVSTAGARCHQRVARVRGTVVAIAVEGARVEYDYLTLGETGGAEVLDALAQERVVAMAREARALLSAPTPPTGRLAVVLDPSSSGTFAHESFGHGTEADQLLRERSYLKPLLGQTVGPADLTLVDDGSYPAGWGTIYFDDEGHPSQRTVLVDHGRFVEVLHDRESAAAMGRRATGNTRRADFLSRPFVRMTNTFVEPGDWSRDELIREARDGVLLEHCTSGIEDPLGGNMQIKVKKAHRIRHGEVGELIGSMALSGKVLDFLRATRGVSRAADFEMSPGYCGKGHTDLLPAGTGGPYLLSEAVVGPA
jgi:TldD protein